MAIIDPYSKSKADLSQYIYGNRGEGGLLKYGDRGTTTGMNTGNLTQIYNKARDLGVGAADVDRIMNLESGTTGRWTQEQGLSELSMPNLAGASGEGFGPSPRTPAATSQTGLLGARPGGTSGFGPSPATQTPGSQAPRLPAPGTQAPGTQPSGLLTSRSGTSRSSSMYDLPTPNPADPYGLPYLRPNLRQVDPATETVQGQLAQIERADSDLMQLAERQGLEQAAKRGLLDTNLAVQSARLATLQEAAPIAQQDAATYMKQALENQRYENEFLGRLQTGSIDLWVARETGQLDTEQMQAEYAERLKLQNADYAEKARMLADEYGLKGDQEGAKQNAALWAQYISGVADINTSNMDLADKQAQIEQLKTTTLSSMAANARYFNNPDMMDFYVDQMSAIDEASARVTPSAMTDLNEEGFPVAQVQNLELVYDAGVDPNTGTPYAVVNGRRYYPGGELPSWGDLWQHNQVR